MKKFILTFIMTVCLSFIGFCQNTITFKGIPIDGSIIDFSISVEKLGYANIEYEDDVVFYGEFNGQKSFIIPQTVNNKVWRVVIVDVKSTDKNSIIARFNELFNQFMNNPKYKHYDGDTINYDENIDYEILVHDKRYSATFCLSDTKINGLVWFTISRQHSNEFIITMFYENWDNKANGSEL